MSPEAKQAALEAWRRGEIPFNEASKYYAMGYDAAAAKLREELAKAWESNGELLLKLAQARDPLVEAIQTALDTDDWTVLRDAISDKQPTMKGKTK